MIYEKTIFAIDNNTDNRTVAKFLHTMDKLKASGKLQGTITHCIGYWQGELEPSYMMDKKEFDEYARPFTQAQQCVLHIPGDARQPCTLEHRTGDLETVGPMVEVDAKDALALPAWTYVQKTGKYFATK